MIMNILKLLIAFWLIKKLAIDNELVAKMKDKLKEELKKFWE